MSAPDAAPLPRLGEVFFDVRGSSRSMRLSWYADTGVAVFSIWQGGMCTGTFRLPIGDLQRMIGILQRGPDGLEPPRLRQERPSGRRRRERDSGHSASRVFRTGAVLYPDHNDERTGVAQSREGPGAVRGSRHARDEAGGDSWAEYGSGDEGNGEPWSEYDGGDEGNGESWPEYGSGGYPPERHDRGYDRDESPAGYGRSRYDQSESAGQGWDDPDDAVSGGYRSERFAPRYGSGGPGEYADIPPRAADPLGTPRQGAYREDLPRGRSQPADYDREAWPEDRYSDGPGYRLPDRPAGSGDGAPGRHSAG